MFSVVESASLIPREGRSQAYLIVDYWDDWFSFRTMFTLVVFDPHGNRHVPGSVKIGQAGLLAARGGGERVAGSRIPDVPTEFDALDSGTFFSLGQDEDYYATLNSMGPDFCRTILEALCDCAFDLGIFMRVGSPSRSLYEQIRMAPAHGLCPLCGQRVVSTVDHYLPQAHYPKLNLTPINLIPACSDCNKSKLANVAKTAEQQSLHPYFDDLGDDRWLIASIQASAPPTVTFEIRPAAAWSNVLSARVTHHFRLMGLGVLYVAQAASELADISYSLEEVGEAAGAAGVRAHLDSQFRSRCARDPNSWKTALYEGLRDSDWFCTEGYRLIRGENI